MGTMTAVLCYILPIDILYVDWMLHAILSTRVGHSTVQNISHRSTVAITSHDPTLSDPLGLYMGFRIMC